MSKSIKNSIDEFVSELQARIDLFKSSLVSSNVDSNKESIESIKNIIQVYTDSSLENLTISNIHAFSLIDIKKILELTGCNKEYIKDVMERLKKKGNNSEIYEEVYKTIVNYIKEFYTMQKGQSEVIANNIQEYERIINLFSSNETHEVIDDIESIINIMNSINLSNDSKANILMYIATTNTTNYAHTLDLEMNRLTENIILKYSPDEESKEYKIITMYDINERVDENRLNELASDMITKTNISYIDCYNSLIGYIINKQTSIFYNTESISEKIEIKDYVTSLVQHIMGIEQQIIQESIEMIEEWIDNYESLFRNGYNDYLEYETLSLEQLVDKYGSFEIAVELKKCLIMHHLIKNVNKIKKFDIKNMKESEEFEYYITLDKLSELKYIMDGYIEMESKQDKKVKE